MDNIRDAATVIIVRQEPQQGLLVLLQERHHKMNFFGGAHVFPGGRVDPIDAAEAFVPQTPYPPGFTYVHANAACREVCEETGLVIHPQDLIPWARWITPSAEPKRFDTRFFLVHAPHNQIPQVDGNESVSLTWWTPQDAIQAHHARQIFLPPPTMSNLMYLVQGSLTPPSPQIPAIVPKVRINNDMFEVWMPWAADYENIEGEGQTLTREQSGALVDVSLETYTIGTRVPSTAKSHRGG